MILVDDIRRIPETTILGIRDNKKGISRASTKYLRVQRSRGSLTYDGHF